MTCSTSRDRGAVLDVRVNGHPGPCSCVSSLEPPLVRGRKLPGPPTGLRIRSAGRPSTRFDSRAQYPIESLRAVPVWSVNAKRSPRCRYAPSRSRSRGQCLPLYPLNFRSHRRFKCPFSSGLRGLSTSPCRDASGSSRVSSRGPYNSPKPRTSIRGDAAHPRRIRTPSSIARLDAQAGMTHRAAARNACAACRYRAVYFR